MVCRSLLYTTVGGGNVLIITGGEVCLYCLLGPPCGKNGCEEGRLWWRKKEW